VTIVDGRDMCDWHAEHLRMLQGFRALRKLVMDMRNDPAIAKKYGDRIDRLLISFSPEIFDA